MEGIQRRARHTWPLLLTLLALVAIIAAACGGDDDDDDTNGDTTPETTATQASGDTATPEAHTQYPVKVTDLLGREVEIKAKPESVVAISPTAVEYVYAVGGKVVGRVSSADDPPEAQQAKDVGTAYQPSFETILSLKPDLVIADSVIHAGNEYRQPLDQLGVPVVYAGAESYDQVLEGLKLVGTIFDAQAKADEVIANVEQARDEAKLAVSKNKVTAVAMIAGRDQTLYAAKDNSYVGDILKQAGIENPAASQPDAGPFPGYSTLAPEKLIEYNPDIIFTITPGPPEVPRLSTLVPQ
ncbi:MAG: ABC transporter substrate-binding protein, partial [Hyphomicrobiales bacterium]